MEGTEKGVGEERSKGMERDQQPDTRRTWGVGPREGTRARVKVNEGVREREVSGGCERDDTIEKEQHERGAG